MKALGYLAVLLVLVACAPWSNARAQAVQNAHVAHTEQWELMSPWLVLQRGMTPEQVIAALGKPTAVKDGARPNWSYANHSSGQTASVTFREGELFSWESPRFTTVEGPKNTTWAQPAQWARLTKGMSHEQAQKVLGVATWVSISNGNQAWFYYDSTTGQNASITFHGNSLFSLEAAGISTTGM